MSEIRVRSKVWLEHAGHPLLGEGRYQLLTQIDQAGSISAAARTLGISYRKAWAQLSSLEENAPFPMLERQTGGKGGGATRLTEQARQLLQDYRSLRRQVQNAADRCFKEHFC